MEAVAAGAVALWDHVRRVASERLYWNSPEALMIYLPVLSYWLVAVFYDVLDRMQLPSTERYRLRSAAEAAAKNSVQRRDLVMRVALQHVIQMAVALTLTMADPQLCDARPARGMVATILEFGAGMLVMDTWQYWIHRAMHESKALYNAIHSHHHRLLVCYAYGALYNHPLEALLLDTLGGVVTLYAANLSCSTAAAFFTFSTIKTVLDHCGYRWPVNPLHELLPNSSAYHDVHHDLRGFRKNYSQPFFTHWDRLCGTYLHPSELKPLRNGGLRQARMAGNGCGAALATELGAQTAAPLAPGAASPLKPPSVAKRMHRRATGDDGPEPDQGLHVVGAEAEHLQGCGKPADVDRGIGAAHGSSPGLQRRIKSDGVR